MTLQVNKGTAPVISGLVDGGNIHGWVLTLEGLPPRADFLKSSTDPTQILILDETAGTFEIYLTQEDTEREQSITVVLRGQNGARPYLLSRDVIQVNP